MRRTIRAIWLGLSMLLLPNSVRSEEVFAAALSPQERSWAEACRDAVLEKFVLESDDFRVKQVSITPVERRVALEHGRREDADHFGFLCTFRDEWGVVPYLGVFMPSNLPPPKRRPN
jgi:hypothetical protein